MRVTFGICFKQHFDARYLAFCNISSPRMFLPWIFFQNIWFYMVPFDPFMSHLATQLGYSAGGVQALPLSLLRLVSWINHLPPACWSTFWKSGCRFDLMDCISSVFVFWHVPLYMSWCIISFFGFIFASITMFFIFSKYSCTNSFLRRSLCTFYMDNVYRLPVVEYPSEAKYLQTPTLANCELVF